MRVTTLFTGVANTHLITNERGVYIIDAGMPLQARRIVNTIRRLGRAPNEVRLILITHGHIDHAGSAVALKRLTGAPIAMHRGDVRLTTTPSLKIPPGRNSTTDVVARLMRAFGWVIPLETFMPDILLDDGQSLREFGLDARVIHTPGHTAGSASFVCDNGTLFLGDSILRLVRVSFPLFWEDAGAAYASALRIHSLKPRVCYSGHGNPFSFDELEKFIQRVKK
jgi:glyoxylase-like metal-dependent hydrolase (beta-lactamase superfamily II)